MSWDTGAGITAEQKYKTMKAERLTADEGEARAIVFGKVRGIVGQLIFAGKVVFEWQFAGDVEVGKESEETYKQVPFRTYSIGICEAEGNVELWRIWRNNKLVYDASRPSWAQNTRFMRKTTFYNGSYSQLPNATLEGVYGVGNVPAFRGTAYMVRRRINLEAFQGAVPQYVFEVDATYIPPAPSGSADLKMTVEAVPDELSVGGTVTVTYTVENLGADDSESAVVNFTSNPELSIISSALSKGTLTGGVWTIGDISNGDSETAEIVYEAIDDGIVTAGATVSAATPDPDLLNNYDFHTVEISLGYDPDAQAIFDMLTVPLTESQMTVFNNAIKYVKGSNPWSRNTFAVMDCLAYFESIPTEELALIDWKRKYKMQVVNSQPLAPISFDKAKGFSKGAGSYTTPSHIATGWRPINGVNFQNESAGCGCYLTRMLATGQHVAFGCTNVNDSGLTRIRRAQDSPNTRAEVCVGNQTAAIFGDITGFPAAWMHGYRNGATVHGIISSSAGEQTGSQSAPAVVRPDSEMVLFSSRSASGAPNNQGNCDMGAWYTGAATTTEDRLVLDGVRAILAAMP